MVKKKKSVTKRKKRLMTFEDVRRSSVSVGDRQVRLYSSADLSRYLGYRSASAVSEKVRTFKYGFKFGVNADAMWHRDGVWVTDKGLIKVLRIISANSQPWFAQKADELLVNIRLAELKENREQPVKRRMRDGLVRFTARDTGGVAYIPKVYVRALDVNGGYTTIIVGGQIVQVNEPVEVVAEKIGWIR